MRLEIVGWPLSRNFAPCTGQFQSERVPSISPVAYSLQNDVDHSTDSFAIYLFGLAGLNIDCCVSLWMR